MTPGLTGIDLELHDAAHGLERIGKQDLGPLESSKQVRRHGKARALDPVEQDRRTTGQVDPALNLGSFQVRIDLALDAYELACPLERLHALARAVKSHRCC